MWQSWVEIKHFIAYFNRIARLKHCSIELPLRVELIHTVYKDISTIHVPMLLSVASEGDCHQTSFWIGSKHFVLPYAAGTAAL